MYRNKRDANVKMFNKGRFVKERFVVSREIV
jgi:hypothetical protein